MNILIENNYIKTEELRDILHEAFNIQYVELDNKHIDNLIVNLLPEEIARKYNVIPFLVEEDKVHLAMINPLNEDIISEIRFITNKEVVPYLERKSKIIYAIENYYNKCFINNIKDKFEKDDKVYDLSNLNNKIKIIEDSPVVRITNSIIYGAIDQKASDIHLEPFEKVANIRYRVDGTLRLINKIPINLYTSVCSRIKTISGMDISKKIIPQDGKLNLKINNKDIDFRVSSIPTIYGEKLVLRVLYKGNNYINLKSLYLTEDENVLMKKIINHPNGIVLIVGSTGSGKTTTLYSMINEINTHEKNIVTLEDPVEYTINGVNQVKVNRKSGMSFAKGLRSILRQDPDIIMLGEIRDEETAQIAIRAAITGHLVFSTLHTNSAFTAVERLINMNVPPYLLGDALVGVVHQRLIKKICPYCKEEYISKEEELVSLGIDKNMKTFYGKGCCKCNYTGYKGRRAVFEIMYIDSGHRELIYKSKCAEDLKAYSVESKITSLKDNCKRMVLDGTTTLKEMTRVCYEEL